MKNLNKLLLAGIVIVTSLSVNSCNPFDELYLTLAMETEFNVIGAGIGIDIFKEENFCLSKFEDYEDNKDKLEEIRYISSAYLTIDSTQELRGDSLTLTLYQGDGSTLLFKYVVPDFIANKYVNKPLKINLRQQEINNLNAYLTNPQEDKCFKATLKVSNVQSTSLYFQLNSKIEFLTELKVKP
ncbi:MAG: hypothetical protein Q8M94_08635 [Ignavibacteria bacterium]|nr:hypothetical protein [Ignavibacteria bacterium]